MELPQPDRQGLLGKNLENHPQFCQPRSAASETGPSLGHQLAPAFYRRSVGATAWRHAQRHTHTCVHRHTHTHWQTPLESLWPTPLTTLLICGPKMWKPIEVIINDSSYPENVKCGLGAQTWLHQMLWTHKHVSTLKKPSTLLYESYMWEEMIPTIEMASRKGDATISSWFVLMLAPTLPTVPTESCAILNNHSIGSVSVFCLVCRTKCTRLRLC